LLAAAYMLYLAWRIARAPLPGTGVAAGRPPGFATGVFLGVGNPKAYVAMAALFSRFVLVHDQPPADGAAQTLMLVAMMIVVDWLWLILGAALTRALRRPRLGRAINLGFAALLVASVALAFVL